MKEPSDKAFVLAESFLEYSGRGLTRSDMLRELAELVDENNTELLEAIHEMLYQVEHGTANIRPDCLSRLHRTLTEYLPVRTGQDAQGDLFPPTIESKD